ncbi:MAG: hypothetical protein AB8F95_06130 [Bacteroidia bacterium]
MHVVDILFLTTIYDMRVFTLLALFGFFLLLTPTIAQEATDNVLHNFEENELELLTGDDDLEALTMSLLEVDLNNFESESGSLRRENNQAKLLLEHIQAEVTMIRRENAIMLDQLETLNGEIEHYEELLENLERENERLLIENDAMSADRRSLEEEDRQLMVQNSQVITENEARILQYDNIIHGYNMDLVELEDIIEENQETIERQIDLIEVCEDMIQTNELMMQPSGK